MQRPVCGDRLADVILLTDRHAPAGQKDVMGFGRQTYGFNDFIRPVWQDAEIVDITA